MKKLITSLLAVGFSVLVQASELNDVTYVRVIDGDTFVINVDNVPEVFGISLPIRLARIDTAEVRYEKCLKEAEMGDKAREKLRSLLENSKKIDLKNVKRGNFFRVVAEVEIDGANVSDLMLISGLAAPFDGRGPKPNWCR